MKNDEAPQAPKPIVPPPQNGFHVIPMMSETQTLTQRGFRATFEDAVELASRAIQARPMHYSASQLNAPVYIMGVVGVVYPEPPAKPKVRVERVNCSVPAQ